MDMSEEIGVGHTAAHVQRFMGQNEEFFQYNRQIITLFESDFPPFLRRKIAVMIADDQKLSAFELCSQFPAALLALRAEITQMIHKIILIYGFIPSSYDLTVHCLRIRKRSFLIESYIFISEMSVRDDKDAGLFFIVFFTYICHFQVLRRF
jgi:hypothetical protein